MIYNSLYSIIFHSFFAVLCSRRQVANHLHIQVLNPYAHAQNELILKRSIEKMKLIFK